MPEIEKQTELKRKEDIEEEKKLLSNRSRISLECFIQYCLFNDLMECFLKGKPRF